MIHFFLIAALCQTLTPPAEPAPTPAPTPVPAPQVATSQGMTAEQLLTRLETSDARISTIQGELVYDKTMVIAGDRRIRSGKLYFRTAKGAPDTSKSQAFAIHFDQLQLGDRIENRQEQYIFNGEWLVEKMMDEKQIIRRQIVKPGEKFDPLKIGEGPLPIPIGQKKDDVLSRYDATLVPATDGLDEDVQKLFAEGAWQLKLIPKEGADRNFKEIRLWYREEPGLEGKPLLPRMARTLNSGGDISVVQLINMRVNEAIPAAELDESAPDKSWTVDERPYRQ